MSKKGEKLLFVAELSYGSAMLEVYMFEETANELVAAHQAALGEFATGTRFYGTNDEGRPFSVLVGMHLYVLNVREAER